MKKMKDNEMKKMKKNYSFFIFFIFSAPCVDQGLGLTGRRQLLTSLRGARVRHKPPSGTSRPTAEPAPTVAPLPIRTGATSELLEPINAPSSTTVLCLLAPS